MALASVMVRWCCLFVAAALCVVPSQAQPGSPQVGVSVGATASTQSHVSDVLEANFETAYLLSPTATVFLMKPLVPWGGIRVEGGYMRKGHRREGIDRVGLSDLTETIRLDMFTARLGWEAGTSVGGGLWLYGALGPLIDVLIGEESELQGAGRRQGSESPQLRYDVFVLGGVFATGLRFDIGLGEAVQVEAFVDQDITPSFENQDLTVRGRAFGLSAGAVF